MSRVSSSYVEPSTTPTQDYAGTPGTDARRFSFKTAARPVLISNTSGTTIYVNINKSVPQTAGLNLNSDSGAADTGNDPSATSFDLTIPSSATAAPIDISYGGQIAIKRLRVYTASGTYTGVVVRGWPIGGA